MDQAKLLSEHARIMNAYGLNSEEEKQFLEQHKNNKELIELCDVAHRLKDALMIRRRN